MICSKRERVQVAYLRRQGRRWFAGCSVFGKAEAPHFSGKLGFVVGLFRCGIFFPSPHASLVLPLSINYLILFKIDRVHKYRTLAALFKRNVEHACMCPTYHAAIALLGVATRSVELTAVA